ncbi:hypothetical protein L2E82_33635 [Cichorium intybus]|uniref:Uncharacterized protein n=1 Tax=Cichorium intybus TaxID=13427 RepID=A0ACB9BKN9_CICIN|nr:hypothetical protein L2E82_33635 [Cichorium intybus]
MVRQDAATAEMSSSHFHIRWRNPAISRSTNCKAGSGDEDVFISFSNRLSGGGGIDGGGGGFRVNWCGRDREYILCDGNSSSSSSNSILVVYAHTVASFSHSYLPS